VRELVLVRWEWSYQAWRRAFHAEGSESGVLGLSAAAWCFGRGARGLSMCTDHWRGRVCIDGMEVDAVVCIEGIEVDVEAREAAREKKGGGFLRVGVLSPSPE
jgi:hypothetical protein